MNNGYHFVKYTTHRGEYACVVQLTDEEAHIVGYHNGTPISLTTTPRSEVRWMNKIGDAAVLGAATKMLRRSEYEFIGITDEAQALLVEVENTDE